MQDLELIYQNYRSAGGKKTFSTFEKEAFLYMQIYGTTHVREHRMVKEPYLRSIIERLIGKPELLRLDTIFAAYYKPQREASLAAGITAESIIIEEETDQFIGKCYQYYLYNGGQKSLAEYTGEFIIHEFIYVQTMAGNTPFRKKEAERIMKDIFGMKELSILNQTFNDFSENDLAENSEEAIRDRLAEIGITYD